MKFVTDNNKELVRLSSEYLSKKHIKLGMWEILTNRAKLPSDELALFILCKIYNQHAVIFTKNSTWSTIDVTKYKTTVPIEQKCDIVLVSVRRGFCEMKKILPDQNEVEYPSQMNLAVAPLSTKLKNKQKGKARSTCSINEILKRVREEDSPNTKKINKVSATVSEDNTLPDTIKCHNTREPTPRQNTNNTRPSRKNRKNFYYSDNVDNHHLGEPPNKSRKKRNIAKDLWEPSHSRQASQQMLTHGKLRANSPEGVQSKLIGTVIKEEETKPKIKNEEEYIRKIEEKNKERNKHKSWPKDARLVHIDGTSCSVKCMKSNNSYHADPDKLNTHETMDSAELEAVTNTSQHTNEETEVNRTTKTLPKNGTPTELEVATQETVDCENDKLQKGDTEQLQESEMEQLPGSKGSKKSGELEVATSSLDHEDSSDQNSIIGESSTKLKNCVSYNIRKTRKKETINGLTKFEKKIHEDEPPGLDSELNLNLEIDKNYENYLEHEPNELPTFEHRGALEDLEALMNIIDDQDNSLLVRIDGPKMPDITKEMNTECGINSDLDIAMENTRFLDANLLIGNRKDT